MIIDFGYVCIEINTQITTPLKLETNNNVKKTSIQIGGSGALQAIAAARAGAKVSKHGYIGDDLFGETILNIFRREGINTSSIIKKKQATHFIQKITDTDKNQTILQKTSQQVEIPTSEKSSNIFNKRNLILIHDDVEEGLNFEIIEKAKTNGTTTILSAKNIKNIPIDIIKNVTFTLSSSTTEIKTKHHIKTEKKGFDCFCGTFAACIQAGLTIEKAQSYAKSAQKLYQEHQSTGYKALPYLHDIENKLKTDQQ